MSENRMTPHKTYQINRLTEAARHFSDATLGSIAASVERNTAQQDADESPIGSVQMIQKSDNITYWRDHFNVIADSTLDLENPNDRKKIRTAIAGMYGNDCPPFMRKGYVGETVHLFLNSPENLPDMMTLYTAAGGDEKSFETGSFNVDEDLVSNPKPKAMPRKLTEPSHIAIEDTPPSGMSRRKFWTTLAAAAGAIGVEEVDRKVRNEPKIFPLGEEALAIFAGSTHMEKEVIDTVIQIRSSTDTSRRNTMIQEIDKKRYPEFKTKVIGKLYIDALRSGDKELATALAENSSTLPEIKFVYEAKDLSNSDSLNPNMIRMSKNFLRLANEGYKADYDDKPAPGDRSLYKKGDYAVAKREDWVDAIKKANEQSKQQGF